MKSKAGGIALMVVFVVALASYTFCSSAQGQPPICECYPGFNLVPGTIPDCVDPLSVVCDFSNWEGGRCAEGPQCTGDRDCTVDWSMSASAADPDKEKCDFSHLLLCGPVIGPPIICGSGSSMDAANYAANGFAVKLPCYSRLTIQLSAEGTVMCTYQFTCNICLAAED